MRNYFSIMSFKKNHGKWKGRWNKSREKKEQKRKNKSGRETRVERRGIEATENRKKPHHFQA